MDGLLRRQWSRAGPEREQFGGGRRTRSPTNPRSIGGTWPQIGGGGRGVVLPFAIPFAQVVAMAGRLGGGRGNWRSPCPGFGDGGGGGQWEGGQGG